MMSVERDQLIDADKQRDGCVSEAIEEVVDFRGERTLVIVEMEQLEAVCQLLRDDPELRYNMSGRHRAPMITSRISRVLPSTTICIPFPTSIAFACACLGRRPGRWAGNGG